MNVFLKENMASPAWQLEVPRLVSIQIFCPRGTQPRVSIVVYCGYETSGVILTERSS